MHFRRHRLFVLLALVALCGWACHGKIPAPVARTDASDWLRSLREGRATLKTLRAEARVEVRRKERRFRFHASILAGFPENLYAETSGFGLVATVTSVTEEGTVAYLPSRQEAYRGESDRVLAAVLGIRQPAKDWIGLLLGELPAYTDPVLGFENVGSKAVLKLGTGKPRVILTFDRKTAWLISFEEKEPIPRIVSFGKPMETTAGAYPSEIKIVTSSGSVDLRIEKAVANPPIPEELFRITLPPGVAPRPIDEGELLKGE